MCSVKKWVFNGFQTVRVSLRSESFAELMWRAGNVLKLGMIISIWPGTENTEITGKASVHRTYETRFFTVWGTPYIMTYC